MFMGIMVSSSKLLQVTGFFLKATFCIPASFPSGMQVPFSVCALTQIFPAMAPWFVSRWMSLCVCLPAPGEPKMVQQILL